jgi:hypothetical protein
MMAAILSIRHNLDIAHYAQFFVVENVALVIRVNINSPLLVKA